MRTQQEKVERFLTIFEDIGRAGIHRDWQSLKETGLRKKS